MLINAFFIGNLMNQWGIPIRLEKEVRARDTTCIYCRVKLIDKMPPNGSRRTLATLEHIVNDARIINRENIARCCVSCNSSKGTKKLSDWLESDYCKKRGITKDTVAEVVRKGLRRRRHVRGMMTRPSKLRLT